MKLSENFTYEEMIHSSTAIKKKIDNTPNRQEIANLSVLCRTVLQPIRVTSGFRSEQLNKAVGGVSTSQHLKGETADIVCANNKELWNIITDLIKKGEIIVGQLINEHNLSWIHISVYDKKHKNQIFSIK